MDRSNSLVAFLARALCPFVPAFREMAGVLLALMDDATELIFTFTRPLFGITREQLKR